MKLKKDSAASPIVLDSSSDENSFEIKKLFTTPAVLPIKSVSKTVKKGFSQKGATNSQTAQNNSQFTNSQKNPKDERKSTLDSDKAAILKGFVVDKMAHVEESS